MRKEKKKQLIFCQLFSFPIKVMLKFSLIRFLTSAIRALVSIFFLLINDLRAQFKVQLTIYQLIFG